MKTSKSRKKIRMGQDEEGSEVWRRRSRWWWLGRAEDLAEPNTCIWERRRMAASSLPALIPLCWQPSSGSQQLLTETTSLLDPGMVSGSFPGIFQSLLEKGWKALMESQQVLCFAMLM